VIKRFVIFKQLLQAFDGRQQLSSLVGSGSIRIDRVVHRNTPRIIVTHGNSQPRSSSSQTIVRACAIGEDKSTVVAHNVSAAGQVEATGTEKSTTFRAFNEETAERTIGECRAEFEFALFHDFG
jgi:hypothetical protein